MSGSSRSGVPPAIVVRAVRLVGWLSSRTVVGNGPATLAGALAVGTTWFRRR
jgi:hypothetical protein